MWERYNSLHVWLSQDHPGTRCLSFVFFCAIFCHAEVNWRFIGCTSFAGLVWAWCAQLPPSCCLSLWLSNTPTASSLAFLILLSTYTATYLYMHMHYTADFIWCYLVLEIPVCSCLHASAILGNATSELRIWKMLWALCQICGHSFQPLYIIKNNVNTGFIVQYVSYLGINRLTAMLSQTGDFKHKSVEILFEL